MNMVTAASLAAPRDPERGQARIRLVLVLPATLYVLVAWLLDQLTTAVLLGTLVGYSLFTLAALLLFLAIRRWPGDKPWRRSGAMALDFTAILSSSIAGGETMLPLFGVLLWVTVGNGLRYGQRYLLLASGFTLTALLIIVAYTPFLQRYPAVATMMLVTALVVPGYVYYLLMRIRHSVEETAAANLAKSRFLAQASHDLRQPIHAISLFTACLRDADLGHEQRRLVDNIDRSLHAVEQLFRSLLDIYTLDQGQLAPRLTVLDLDTLLDGLISQNVEAARWAGVEMRWRRSGRLIHSDPALLTTLLQNLLSNALKYAPGRPVLIAVRARQERLAITVYDQGRGIAAEHLPHLFEEFYRIHHSRERDVEGVGLGLPIVQRIATLLGLTLSIRSQPGRGTAFTLAGLRPATAPAAPVAPAVAVPPPLLTGLRVLLIEDDGNVLRAMAMLLEKWGCQVQTFQSIPHAPVACDLVITDFDLDSTASGADCIAYLNRPQGPRIPAIVVTGHDVQQVQHLLADPEIPVLAKPVRPAELRALLLSFRAGVG